MARDDDFDIDIDEDDKGTGPADEHDDENGDDADPKPKPDADRDRLRNAVKATRKERDEARRELAEMKREIAELKRGAGDGGKSDSKADAERDREADERAFTRYRPVLVRAAAESALVRAGAKPERVGRLTKLLEVDDVAVDEGGRVDADDLAAEVDRLKEEMPELFKGDDDEDDRKPSRRPAGSRRVDGGKSGKPPVTSSTSRLAAQLTGRR